MVTPAELEPRSRPGDSDTNHDRDRAAANETQQRTTSASDHSHMVSYRFSLLCVASGCTWRPAFRACKEIAVVQAFRPAVSADLKVRTTSGAISHKLFRLDR